MRRFSSVAIVTLLGCLAGFSQQAEQSKCAEKIQALPNNKWTHTPLQLAISAGQKGSDVHQPWMDEMNKLGIKRVDITLNFDSGVEPETWGAFIPRGGYVVYYSNYDFPLHEVSKETLAAIHETKLEKTLIEAGEGYLDSDLIPFFIESDARPIEGTAAYTLFDSECLPRLVEYLTSRPTRRISRRGIFKIP